VGDLLGTAGAAAGIFAGTNVDDLLILTVLFLSGRATGRPRRWQIWAGQYAGIGALVAVSVVAALGLTLLPDRWVPLLGLVPIALGIRGLVTAVRRSPGDDTPPVAGNAFAVAGVTIANGADNIAVYTPAFRTIGVTGTAVTLAVFAVLVAVWCLASSWLGSHRRVDAVVERHGHRLVPLVFITIGAVILTGLF
jgi:cadmium resistance protein CadD (predicted permease)